MGRQKADVVIIGAGIMGACIAFELAKKGRETLVVDKLPAAGQGSTANTCAIIRMSYSTRDGVALAHEGLHYWQNWEAYLEVTDELGFAGMIPTGEMLLKSDNGHWKKVVRHFSELGIPFKELTIEQVKERWPFIDGRVFGPPKRPDDPGFFDEPSEVLAGALFTPGGGYVGDPVLSVHNVQRAAEAKGATFIFNAEVAEIRHNTDRVTGVSLGDGTVVEAPVVINAAGPHSFVINRMAGVEDSMTIKTRALRHEVHHVPSPDGVDFGKVGCHTSDGDTGVYIRPEVGNHILVGSEDPECDPKEWIDDPDRFNREITDEQFNAQVYRLARRIPDLPIPNKKVGFADLYDVTDDWIPIYDRSDLEGFYMAVGTSGNQYKNGPAVGALMAELIERCEAGHDHDNDPVQFTTRYTRRTLNLGFYSRRREINPDSSFSVNG
jgi:sarcosine oxidase subunit beta